jgi:flagellar biosynthesis protein FlhG
MSVDQAEQLRIDAMTADAAGSSPARKPLSGKCRVIAVSSGKGGVGKTSLTLNLGLALIRLGYKVVIIDADLGLANIDVMINATPRYNLADVISGEKKVSDILLRGPLDLKIVPGGSGVFELANLDRGKRQGLIDQLADLESEGDFILIDTAAGLSRNVISFVGAADDLILVTTPEPTALTDAYGMLKVLVEKKLKHKSHVVVNSTRGMQQGCKTFDGLNRVVCKYMPGMKLNFLGDVRYDPVVSSAVHTFSPFVISRPRSPASVSVSRIAWRLASRDNKAEVEKQGVAGFFERLKKIVCD